MRAISKLFVFTVLVLGSLQYYCGRYGACPAQIAVISHYTWPCTYAPAVRDKLGKASEWYGANAAPHVSVASGWMQGKVMPHLTKVSQWTEKHVQPRMRQAGADAIVTARVAWNVVQQYQRRHVVPLTGRLLAKCPCLERWAEQAARGWQWLCKHARALATAVQQQYPAFVAHMGGIWEPLHGAYNRIYLDLGRPVQEKTSEDASAAPGGTQYITSTITMTMTSLDELVTVTAEDGLSDVVEASFKDLVADEFSAWQQAIERKADSVLQAFTEEVGEFEMQQHEAVAPKFRALLKHISAKSQEHYAKINQAIRDINSTMELDPATNQTIWFDAHGTQLHQYITRPLMREYFSQANDELANITNHIRAELREVVDSVNGQVDVIRQEHIEVYEEWADVMVSEWSRRMAYIDVVDRDLEAEAERNRNWKRFLKLKKRVIKVRDQLLEHPVKFNQLETFLKEIQSTLRILAQENGEYLYILRSKANLSFQEREKNDRLREQHEQEAREMTLREQLSTELAANGTEVIIDTFEVDLDQLLRSNSTSWSVPPADARAEPASGSPIQQAASEAAQQPSV
ncbi:AFR244Cp [Eremothecium gossypii ATCC 10895]|uniref:Outer spore wall assembly protein SHE10 n=1 Tax=Eremothecium gossypii (strain ATCC 10895 / CBS 109.51 / FGSC 9923 / NRRL Y-1056) TaxID=284811 RepID=SHE10_EREGS|nr:AFR244Cp [Eremothecium gossypii ATCC 10895]Q753T2.1 RecName: Full=Outer spore wall assembly protein SHE10; AltName: Full=Sensitivity to high expression protein 10; Flags: Precursor [Eremothecium gossypii ATCC 10895]AAS53615.1 AFR244Cp [Eremothecium gossypii ATCC 10895]